MSRLGPLPIRLRLTLAFALTMTVLLGLAGAFLYVRLGRALDDSTEAETLESLLAGLLLGGPVVVALSSLAAYRLAAGALEPVEAMRREAEAVSALEPGRRLAVPDTRDEVERLAATLNEMLERLDAALERERRIVADAGHELRLPLTALRAELELALTGERSREELVTALRSALVETERLSRLADDLLVLARAADGAVPVHLEPFDARACCRVSATATFPARGASVGRSESTPKQGSLRRRTACGSSKRSATSSTTRSSTVPATSCSMRAPSTAASSSTSSTRARQRSITRSSSPSSGAIRDGLEPGWVWRSSR